MKKSLFFVAAAALFAACSQDTEAPEIALENSAISFSAYTSTPVTRGTVITTDKFLDQTDGGIGVFAFYQPAVNGVEGPGYTILKYPTPDFMYNEHIKYDSSNKTWSYDIIKFWPNNTGDRLSFFAYAPYKASTTWEDLNFSTNASGSVITRSFDIHNDVTEQVDYLFAAPQTDLAKPTTGTISQDGTGKAKIENVIIPTGGEASSAADVVRFDFKHATSKVNLYVGVNTDRAVTEYSNKTAALAWTDENTEIEIQSIEFKDLATTLTWSSGTWSASGKQDIVVTPYNNGSTNYGLIKKGWVAGWHHYLQTNGTLNVEASTEKVTETTTANDQFMFIAPQTLTTEEIVITYVVRTTDANLKLNGGKSEITNVITKTWNDFQNADFTGFEAGKQYRLFFLIGMQSVKVAATITDWKDADKPESVIDVPAANN